MVDERLLSSDVSLHGSRSISCATLSSSCTPPTTSCTPPTPLLFNRLISIFRQVNTHLTFLSKHSRSTTPTAALIQKVNPTISLLDLQLIKEILPCGDVFYEYLDEVLLSLAIQEKVEFSWDKGYKQSHSSMDNAYLDFSQNPLPSQQILVFDFTDTKLHGIGAAIKKRKQRRLPHPHALSPSASAHTPSHGLFVANDKINLVPLTLAQIMLMIQGRNRRFEDRVAEYIGLFSPSEIDDQVPMTRLIARAQANVPVPADYIDPVQSLLLHLPSKNKPATELSLELMLDTLKLRPFYRDQIAHSKILTHARTATYAQLPPDIDGTVVHPDLAHALQNYRNICLSTDLYSHQAEALEALMFSHHPPHVIVSTSTSSGKSLIYQLPILNSILWDIHHGRRSRSSTAIFIFPTKALAQDQKRHLQEFINYLPINNSRKIIVDTYDGDTPAQTRRHIKDFADIIFTNPDSIHASILPNHDSLYTDLGSTGWHLFLKGLKYVVMDELHVYKGTFGIHVSYVMARLQRLALKIRGDSVSGRITFVSCSATIQNPESHFRTICSIPRTEPVKHISVDGSPCPEKLLIVWSPPPLMDRKGGLHGGKNPLVGATLSLSPSRNLVLNLNLNLNRDLNLVGGSEKTISPQFIPRENIIPELAKLLVHLLETLPTLRILVFCPVRVVCELMMKEVRSILKNPNATFRNVTTHEIMSYRGGYSKEDRRVIERKMFAGDIRGIIATNALELGIDLSDLDIVLTCGFPMLKSNLHQQFGRAGRGRNSKGSLAIFVAGPGPLDQYYVKNSDELCHKSYEDLCVEALMELGSHELIMEMQTQCAAYEWPISLQHDTAWFLPDGLAKKDNMFVKLCRKHLHLDAHGMYRTSPKYLPWPADHVSLRLIEETHYNVVDITEGRNVVIEEVEELRTSFTLYEGGIFLHQGNTYLVKEFNTTKKFAKVERVNVDWVTSQRDFTDVDPLEIEYIKQLFPPNLDRPNDIPVYYGPIKTTINVFGFFKVNKRGEILEAVEVHNPPVELMSKGFWINVPGHILGLIEGKKLSAAGGIHAAQHAIMNVLPLFISGGATTNPNARFVSNVGDTELTTECKAPEKEFAHRETARKRPFRLIFRDTNGGARGLGISAKTFEYIDDILQAAFLRVYGCECEWGCPECVTGSLCKERLQVMSKPAAIIILAALLGEDMSSLLLELADGPELNMPQITIETIVRSNLIVKLSPEVEIIRAVKASKPLLSVKEEPQSPKILPSLLEELFVKEEKEEEL